MKKTFTWTDLWFEAEFDYHEHEDRKRITWVDFIVWELYGVDSDGGGIVYRSRTDEYGEPDRDKAQVFLQGCIKWDGCGEFEYAADSDGDTFTHFCGRCYLTNMTEMMHRLYDKAAVIMGREDQGDFKR